jgi:hypothetical protein
MESMFFIVHTLVLAQPAASGIRGRGEMSPSRTPMGKPATCAMAPSQNKVVVVANLRWRSQPVGDHDHKKSRHSARLDRPCPASGDQRRQLPTEDTENAEVELVIGD